MRSGSFEDSSPGSETEHPHDGRRGKRVCGVRARVQSITQQPDLLSLHDARPTDIGPYAPEEMRGTRPQSAAGVRDLPHSIRSSVHTEWSARTLRFQSRTPQARTSSS